jgi:hypothetical protein
MRVWAAQKLSFDHAGDNEIAGVPGPAGYLVGAVYAPDRCADYRKLALNLQAETSFSPRIHQNYAWRSPEGRFATITLVNDKL